MKEIRNDVNSQRHCSECFYYEPCPDYRMYCKALQKRITARKKTCKLYKTTSDIETEEWIKADKPIEAYPAGTKFKAVNGGYWIKTEDGWYKWCTGAKFPRVGGDYIGLVCLPK